MLWRGAVVQAAARFSDVPETYWAYSYIDIIAVKGISSGCTPTEYCPDHDVDRAQMAVFLLRAEHGQNYVPPAATGTVFDDVPATHWAAAWIEQLASEGITGGCGGSNYCPGDPLSRAQMAVFLLRAKHGQNYVPPTATGTVFGDVPATHWAAAWIEQLASEGVTSGCDASDYCPDASLTRAQMAVFIVRTFGLDRMDVLNDTGIAWGGDYPNGNTTTCTSNITGPQDCHQGRDANHNDNSDGHAGFSFSKLNANGEFLPASASSWSCVKDNVTGLIWEVKTDDGGIHDKDNTYHWGGKTHLGSGFGTYYNDWDTLVDGSNAEQLCGLSGWRVPTAEELQSIVNYGRTNPAIDTNYFPNTPGTYFWSASPVAYYSYGAWGVSFDYGHAYYGTRCSRLQVRLVRSGQ